MADRTPEQDGSDGGENSRLPDRGHDALGGRLAGSVYATLWADHPEWDGIPTAHHLAEALQRVIDSEELSSLSVSVLAGVIAALNGGSTDGWNLKLSGPKGPRETVADVDRDIEIATFIVEEMETGTPYEFAVDAAVKRFPWGSTVIKEAYAIHGHELRHLLRKLNRL